MGTLRTELESLQRKLIWRVRLQALLVSFGLLLCCTLTLGWVDYQFRSEHSLLRSLVSISFWICVLSVLVFHLIPRWRRKISVVDVALALEGTQQLPTGAISTVVDLERVAKCSQDVSAWNQSIIERTLNRETQLPSRLRSGLFFFHGFVVVGICLSFVVLHPSSTVTTLIRIGSPTSLRKWPQLTKLKVLDQSGRPISVGSILSVMGAESSQFYVVDEVGDPPEDVTLEIRRKSQLVKQIRLQGKQATMSGDQNTTIFDFKLVPNSAEILQFRVVGGDDHGMPWTTLLRELKPVIQEISCRIVPPAYLRMETVSLKNWAGVIQAPVDSLITCELLLNRIVAELEVRGVDGTVFFHQTASNSRFTFPLHVTASGEDILSYEVFVKVGREQSEEISLSAPWQRVKRIQLAPEYDRSPEVFLLTPLQNTQVTSTALIPVQALATDDHGLASLSVDLTATGEGETVLLEAAVEGELQEEIQEQFALSRMHVREGDELDITARAADRSPEATVVSSQTVRLRVVSEATKEQEVKNRLKQLTSALYDVFASQQALLEETQQLFESFPQDLPTLAEAEKVNLMNLKQQRLIQTLQQQIYGQQVLAVVAEVRINQLKNEVLREAVATLETTFQESLNPQLEAVENAIQRQREQLRELDRQALQGPRPEQFRESFQQTVSLQQQVVSSLSQMMRHLDRWVEATDVRMQWEMIQSDLLSLIGQLTTIAPQTVSKPVSELTMQQTSSLRDLATAHQLLATRLNSLLNSFPKVQGESWRQLEAGLTSARSVEQLQSAASAINENNVLTALKIDQELQQLFQDLERQRAQIKTKKAADLIIQLHELHERLQHFANEQQALSVQWGTGGIETGLQVEQQRIGNEIQAIEIQVKELGINQVAQHLHSYAEHTATLLEFVANQTPLPVQRMEEEFRLMQKSLNLALQQMEESLGRLKKRDQQQLLQDLAETAQQLLQQHTEASLRLKIIFESFQQSGRLLRRQRQELLALADLERSIPKLLANFQSAFVDVPVVSETLRSIELKSTAVGELLGEATVSPELLKEMNEISSLLLQLSLTSATGGNASTTAGAGTLAPEVLAQLQILQQRQTELISEVQQLIKAGGEVAEDVQQSLTDRQREIDALLNRLLQGIE